MQEIQTFTTLRVEIFYDMHPTETGWFLVNKDTNEEVYASKFDKKKQIPSNKGKGMSLVIEEFNRLEPGSYWFVIADAALNGICCQYGEGSIRIVELKWSTSYSYTAAQRDHSDSTTGVEERVLWQHNGRFQAYAEAHFQL